MFVKICNIKHRTKNTESKIFLRIKQKNFVLPWAHSTQTDNRLRIGEGTEITPRTWSTLVCESEKNSYPFRQGQCWPEWLSNSNSGHYRIGWTCIRSEWVRLETHVIRASWRINTSVWPKNILRASCATIIQIEISSIRTFAWSFIGPIDNLIIWSANHKISISRTRPNQTDTQFLYSNANTPWTCLIRITSGRTRDIYNAKWRLVLLRPNFNTCRCGGASSCCRCTDW